MDHYHISIAAADRDKANAALEAAGHGPSNFWPSCALVSTAKAEDAAADRYWCGIQPNLLASFTGAMAAAGVAYTVTKGDLSKAGWDTAAKAAVGMKTRSAVIKDQPAKR